MLNKLTKTKRIEKSVNVPNPSALPTSSTIHIILPLHWPELPLRYGKKVYVGFPVVVRVDDPVELLLERQLDVHEPRGAVQARRRPVQGYSRRYFV